MNPDGSYTYDLNAGTLIVESLPQGMTVQETFEYTISDGSGGTATAMITIDVHGTNDAPHQIATVPTQFTESGQPIVPFSIKDYVTEVDLGDINFYQDNLTLPTGIQIDPITGVFSGTMLANDGGPFNVSIVAEDIYGATTIINFEWHVGPGYTFDALNDAAEETGESKSMAATDEESGSSSEILFSQRVEDMGSEPILAGAANPGTVLVGRIYAPDGSIIGEARDTANSAGNWVLNFSGNCSTGQTRVVIEHVATGNVALGEANFEFDEGSYRTLQLGVTHTEGLSAGSILSSCPSEMLGEMGNQNINPLNLL